MPVGAAEDTCALVAQATARYPFKVWGFGESIAMEGLLAAGGEHRAFATRLIQRWARDTGPLGEDPLAHVAPGLPLLEVYVATGEEQLLRRARELADLLAATTQGANEVRIHRPDLAGWEHEVWVDCMHLDGPFLAWFGGITHEPAWQDLAADLLLGHARVLQDERTGLFSHGFDDSSGQPNGVFWGRGQGWALLGLTDTLRNLPADHQSVEEIGQRLRSQVAGLACTEAAAGTWHTVVDQARTYLESSVSAFVALGLRRAMRATQISADYEQLADRARAATLTAISVDGELTGVSDATPVGADAAHYGSRGLGVFPWGQGAALLDLAEQANDEALREAMNHD